MINKKLPDMEFASLLKAHKKRLHYIMGTVFSNTDLEKTCIEKVDNVLSGQLVTTFTAGCRLHCDM
jgi:hypothetical protein